jgi:NAD+ kinase
MAKKTDTKLMFNPSKIHFYTADTEDAKMAEKELLQTYKQHSMEEADVIVALGGDGTLLEAMHKSYETEKPVYGMNRGSVGFLLNPYNKENLVERIEQAHSVTLHPLKMLARTQQNEEIEAIAFNEVSLLREKHYAAKIRISVNDVERLPELICDGILVSTPAGSTAYNFSVQGPIIPLSAQMLALTPISAFRPRHWQGALLHNTSKIKFEILRYEKRPVSVTADFTEVRDITSVDIWESRKLSVSLLFDPGNNLDERILKEQFMLEN